MLLSVIDWEAQTLQATLPQLDAQRDPDTLARLIAFAEAACVAVARLQPSAAAASLGAAFARLAPMLAAPADGTRRAAADALTAIARTCVAVAASEQAQQPQQSVHRDEQGGPGGLERAVAALVAVLQPSYHDAWPMALPVAAETITALGAEGAETAAPLLQPLADMCRCDAHAHACGPWTLRAMPRAPLDLQIWKLICNTHSVSAVQRICRSGRVCNACAQRHWRCHCNAGPARGAGRHTDQHRGPGGVRCVATGAAAQAHPAGRLVLLG